VAFCRRQYTSVTRVKNPKRQHNLDDPSKSWRIPCRNPDLLPTMTLLNSQLSLCLFPIPSYNFALHKFSRLISGLHLVVPLHSLSISWRWSRSTCRAARLRWSCIIIPSAILILMNWRSHWCSRTISTCSRADAVFRDPLLTSIRRLYDYVGYTTRFRILWDGIVVALWVFSDDVPGVEETGDEA